LSNQAISFGPSVFPINTLMSLTATIVAPYDLKFPSKPNKMALQHFLVTISVLMEVVIMPIYWGMLHEGAMRNAAGDPVKVFYQWWAHSIPAMASCGNFFISDFLFYRVCFRRHSCWSCCFDGSHLHDCSTATGTRSQSRASSFYFPPAHYYTSR